MVPDVLRHDNWNRRVGRPADPAAVEHHAATHDVVLGIDVVVILSSLIIKKQLSSARGKT